jgi:hypothetical protein
MKVLDLVKQKNFQKEEVEELVYNYNELAKFNSTALGNEKSIAMQLILFRVLQ